MESNYFGSWWDLLLKTIINVYLLWKQKLQYTNRQTPKLSHYKEEEKKNTATKVNKTVLPNLITLQLKRTGENLKMGLNIPKLEGIGNWPEYKKNIRLLLTVNKVLGIVDGTRQKPTKSEQADKQAAELEATAKWDSEDAIAQLLITKPDVSQLIIPCLSAKDIWDKLISVYEQSSGQRLDMLYNQFFIILLMI